MNIKEMNENEAVEFVKLFPSAIRQINRPIERVQLAAVQANSTAINHIDYPTKKAIRAFLGLDIKEN